MCENFVSGKFFFAKFSDMRYEYNIYIENEEIQVVLLISSLGLTKKKQKKKKDVWSAVQINLNITLRFSYNFNGVSKGNFFFRKHVL